ncbi:universal stress protein [Pandoraea sputorum]|uniref:universal stress protein n=1 Tax=Pandoraea sputorum TaxID=93222 RepID=UPI00123FEBF5|nr:universal stress protein [Pandoraea sputorum]VVE58820.1 universal stress protein [Pandoraea sputorum]
MADIDPLPYIEALRAQGEHIRGIASPRVGAEDVNGDVEIRELPPVSGDVAQQINLAAEEFAAEAIVVGTHGRRGVRRSALGSVAETCVRQTQRPVILIPAPSEPMRGKPNR